MKFKLIGTAILRKPKHLSSLLPWASKAGVGGWGGGGGGRVPRSRKISGGRPPRNYDFSVSFFLTHENFAFANTFKIKWSKPEEKFNFEGRWAWVPMNPSPQTKLRGDALVCSFQSPAKKMRVFFSAWLARSALRVIKIKNSRFFFKCALAKHFC